MRVVRVLEDALHRIDNGGEGHVSMLGFDVTTMMPRPELSRPDRVRIYIPEAHNFAFMTEA